jgi:hypothetical protein
MRVLLASGFWQFRLKMWIPDFVLALALAFSFGKFGSMRLCVLVEGIHGTPNHISIVYPDLITSAFLGCEHCVLVEDSTTFPTTFIGLRDEFLGRLGKLPTRISRISLCNFCVLNHWRVTMHLDHPTLQFGFIPCLVLCSERFVFLFLGVTYDFFPFFHIHGGSNPTTAL